MATFVQFNSADEVMQAYNSRGIDVWAICQGKELICAGCGPDELQTFLNMLEKGRYPIIYTLKVFNSVKEPDDITNKTECNGSFKFQFETAGAVAGIASPRFAGTQDVITAKINGVISEKVGKFVEDLLSGKSAEEKKPSLKEIAMGYLENPEDLQQVVATIGSVVQMFKSAGAAAPAMVAGPRIPERFAGTTEPMEQADKDALGARLVTAINRLEKCDPTIVIHLEQLANLAENKPETYKMALNFLT